MMALSQAQKQSEVLAALRAHFPDSAGDNLTVLRAAFERRHLGELVKSYREKQADAALEAVDIADI
jgi:hypothetical protein